MQRIIQTRLNEALSRPTLTRLHRATGGNPMMFLEMAQALQRRAAEPAASDPLPFPADFRVLVTERLRGLAPANARGVAADGRPRAADGDRRGRRGRRCRPGRAGVWRRRSPRASLSSTVERVRFTHPLIASIPYSDLTGRRSPALHQRLAASVTDPEEHARHAALGSDAPSSVVAMALDSAAAHARRRGSIDAAAELAQLALSRTPDVEPENGCGGALKPRAICSCSATPAGRECCWMLGSPRRYRGRLGWRHCCS